MKLTNRDFGRVAALGAIAALLMYDDDSWRVVAYSIGVIVLLTLANHILRRITFHRIDLQDYAESARQNPIGAAIVFASVVYFFTNLTMAGVGLLR